MIRAIIRFALFTLALVLGPVALAQQETFLVKPDESQIKVILKTTHEVVTGTFQVKSGSVTFDRNVPGMSGAVVVTAGSGKTGNSIRDKKMNKEILQVEQYSTVSFEPKSYTGVLTAAGDSAIQVKGIFTLLATPHEITIPMQVHLGPSTARATAQFSIPYIGWGLKDPSFLFWKAEKQVTIDLALVGQIAR